MTTITGNSKIANNLWATEAGQTLKGQSFNDILHAVYNNTTMTGGAGKDHFHVDMTAGSAVTGTKIKDLNASESDRLILDGIGELDASKISISANGNDYDISYDGKFVATVNLQYTPTGGKATDWNPDLEQAKGAITRMIKAGQEEAKSDYFYGTDKAQLFAPSLENFRKANIVGFDPTNDSLGLAGLALLYEGLGNIENLVRPSIKGQGDDRYISINATGREAATIKLKEGMVTDANLEATMTMVKESLGYRI